MRDTPSAHRHLIQAVEDWKQGRITRREVLVRTAAVSSAALAIVLVPIIERHSAHAAVPPKEVVMMSLQEMSDRLEIQKNLFDYAMAVDMKNWAALDHVFSEDAKLDYVSGGVMTRTELKAWLAKVLGRKELGRYYHLLGHMQINMMGDNEAESITACFNPMETLHPDGRASLMLSGPFYHWLHVRTAAGWRIKATLPRSPTLDGFRYQLPPIAHG